MKYETPPIPMIPAAIQAVRVKIGVIFSVFQAEA
jgi:hypothetical protein